MFTRTLAAVTAFALLLMALSALPALADGPIITTVAGTGKLGNSGDGGPAIAAQIGSPSGITMDAAGNLYFSTVTVSLSADLQVVEASVIRKVDTAGNISTLAAVKGLQRSDGLAFDGSGNLYISDRDANRIYKLDSSGQMTTVAGTGNSGYSGDGGPATAAQLAQPQGLAVDPAGNLYVADNGNGRVRKVDTSGKITTVAGTGKFGYSGDGGPATQATIGTPEYVALDEAGNLYFTDGNNSVRKVDTSGKITTVAGTGKFGYSGDGGPATQARLEEPMAIAVDSAGNLYVGDSVGSIRKVDTDGIITRVVGTGTPGFGGDGGPPTAAQLSVTTGLFIDSANNLYISDFHNFRVRKVGAPKPQASVDAGKSTLAAAPLLTPGDGKTATTVTVTLLAADGTTPVSGKTVTLAQGSGNHAVIGAASGPSDAKGQVTFTVTDATPEDVTFTATDSTDNVAITQTATVTFLAHPAYVKGYPDGTFKPDDPVTRAQLAKVLAVALGLDTANAPADGFPDVATDFWAHGFINAAKAKGLIKGFPDGTFNPGGQVTHGQLAAIVARQLGLQPVANAGSHWAAGYIAAIRQAGFLKDFKDQTYDPDAPATRAEVVVLVEQMTGRQKATGNASVQFTDVPATYWAAAYIQDATHEGWAP